MHLNDAIGKNKTIRPVCCHHEQACAMAAEAFARIKSGLGVINVTTGPGGTNALTGVLGAWLDSIPMLILSGQVRYATTVPSTGLPLRQLGDQEADIISIVKPITKYAVSVTDPKTLRYHLEKAIYLAMTGRPGPVWVDVPLDVQAAMISEDALEGFDPNKEYPNLSRNRLKDQVSQVIEQIKVSKRPVVFGGYGVRLSGAADQGIWKRVAEKLGIPVQVAWNAIDLFPSSHPLYFGRPSTLGQRSANFIFQNCDLLINVGCRMNLRQIGYTFEAVAREAFKVSVDADPIELRKPTFSPNLAIEADAKEFLNELYSQLEGAAIAPKKDWLNWCAERRRRYPPVLAELDHTPSTINPYRFTETMGGLLAPDDLIVSSNGTACVIPIQCLEIKDEQRYIVNSGCASMGYGLPAAIGAAFAGEGRRVICLEGDGSIQMNIQELQVLVHHQLPIKVVVYNNNGYLSIRTTQSNFFNKNFIGESATSGISFPDFIKLAAAYGIPASRISDPAQITGQLKEALSGSGPAIIEVMVDPEQLFMPRVSSQRLPDGRMVSKPLEDLFPFLDREEFAQNMIIQEWNP
jgi:acetolactate synthase-1/2/3 large subunit